MTFTVRSTALVLAGLTAMTVAPAQAFQVPEPLIFGNSNAIPTETVQQPIPASLQLPNLSEPDPLAPASEGDVATEIEADDDASVTSTPHPTGDLAAKVAALRGSDPGSRELECLAVGIYYESKSEPLAGQLAVGHVIANRANSRPFRLDLLRRIVPARAVQLRARQVVQAAGAWYTSVAQCGRRGEDRRPEDA